MKPIQMVDLVSQYERIKPEIDAALFKAIYGSQYINGPEVKSFQLNLANYLGVKRVIACANGTDALQIALMALELPSDSEVIVPAFNYVATVEVIALLGFKPVFVDVDPDTFSLLPEQVLKAITPKTRVIMPVHLFGQCAPMSEIMSIASRHKLWVVEDTAQAIGSTYQIEPFKDQKAGTIGHIGTTSFFPSKNLGCMGDGGAIYTNDEELADRMAMIAGHGQKQKYQYERVGVNSRLDTLQAALLDVKLRYLDGYITARRKASAYYREQLSSLDRFKLPYEHPRSTHVYHQFTITLLQGERAPLLQQLQEVGIPTMIYYPSPLHLQKAYAYLGYKKGDFPVSEQLSETVFSLPMHTELGEDQLQFICEKMKELT
jgi:UDP-2-acetamido-2-deoxy-ribo-hexuluronate aminotransferase